MLTFGNGINEAGGILGGRKVEYTEYDMGYSADAATMAFKMAVADGAEQVDQAAGGRAVGVFEGQARPGIDGGQVFETPTIEKLVRIDAVDGVSALPDEAQCRQGVKIDTDEALEILRIKADEIGCHVDHREIGRASCRERV